MSFRINNKDAIYLIEINLEISGELIHEKLIRFKNKKTNSFNWYLDVFFLNKKNINQNKFLKKKIKVNDKILRIGNVK